jgi:hypothetical protein
MNTLINLLKAHQIGTWCKRAAWVIVAVYLIEMAFAYYNATRQFGLEGQPLTLAGFLQALSYTLVYVPNLLFYFFILNAAGAVVDHVLEQRTWTMRRPIFLKATHASKPEPTLPQ